MNFSVHFDDETVERLARAVAQHGLTRNRIIVKAVQDWLVNNEEKDWPAALKSHFRNPAPELATDAVDLNAWRAQTAPEPGARW